VNVTETTRAVSAPPPAPASAPVPPQYVPRSIIFYYEMYLRNVDASLASLAEVKGFRNFVKARADSIGVTGFIQRFHANDLKLGFEGSEEQCDDFLNWLFQLNSDYHMIGFFQFITEAFSRRRRLHVSFEKIMDHSRLKERGSTVYKGPYSDSDMDKLSDFLLIELDSSELVLQCSVIFDQSIICQSFKWLNTFRFIERYLKKNITRLKDKIRQ
jgi:acylphosphatase